MSIQKSYFVYKVITALCDFKTGYGLPLERTLYYGPGTASETQAGALRTVKVIGMTFVGRGPASHLAK